MEHTEICRAQIRYAIDFLFYSYFRLDLNSSTYDIINSAIDKAYLDAVRQGAYNTLVPDNMKEKSAEIKDLAKNQIFDFLSSVSIDDYRIKHDTCCDNLVNLYSEIRNKNNFELQAFTFGNAQKWVNMTTKYIYLICVVFSNITEQHPFKESVALATLPLHDGEEFHVGIYFEDEINKPSGLDLKVGVSTEGVYFKSDYEPNKKTGVFCEKLTFHAYQSVYFVQPYSKTDLENNRRLQINLLKLAIFYGECSNKLSEAAKSLNGNYKELVSGKSSFLNFLNSQEFKTLKNCYDNGMPLDRNLFDSVFSRIVCVYPNLYDKTVQRLPYEQVQADIQKYANMFNDKFVELFTVLGVPTQFKRFSGEVPYLFTNLSAYAGRMEENAELSLDEALDLQESERIESDRLKREERAEREYQQSNSSGGHGFLSSLAHRGIENANIRRNAGKVGKRDLIGQAGCAKTYGGNCSTCNIRHGCSRYLY